MEIDSVEGIQAPSKNASKFIHASPSKKLKAFKEAMAEELNHNMILGIDNVVKDIPEECVEYIGEITEFIRDTET